MPPPHIPTHTSSCRGVRKAAASPLPSVNVSLLNDELPLLPPASRPSLPIASSSSLLTACLLKSFSEFLSRPLPSSDPGRAASSRRGGRGPRGRSEKGSAPVHIGTNLTQDRRENTCFSFWSWSSVAFKWLSMPGFKRHVMPTTSRWLSHQL